MDLLTRDHGLDRPSDDIPRLHYLPVEVVKGNLPDNYVEVLCDDDA